MRYFTAPELKQWMVASVIIVSLISGRAIGQSIPQYITKLEAASSAQEFEKIFSEMMTLFHAGKMPFKDEDVTVIVNIARSKSFSESILPSVYGWAGTMFGNGRMNDAIVYFMESALLFKKQHKSVGESLSYFEIALIQHKAENYEEAKEYYTKTLEVGKDSLHHRTLINCYNGLALILREQGMYGQALPDFRKAYNIAISKKDTAWIAILAGNIGSIHLREKHYDSSLYYYFRNLALIRNTTETENIIETYAHLGRLYLLMKNHRLSFRYLDSAQFIIDERQIKFNDFFNPMDYIHESYANLYSDVGDYKKAFEHQSKAHQIGKEKQRLINSRNLKQLQASQSFRQKQSELELLQQINEANIATISQHRYVQIAFCIIIILMSILAYIAFNTSKVRKKLNIELSHSNEELGRLNRIKDQLFSVISHDLRGPIANLQAVVDLYRIGGVTAEQFGKLLDDLNDQIKASGNALENLLQWARTQLGDIKINPEKIVLRDVADRVVSQLKRNLEMKKIAYEIQLPADIIAWADKNQVEIIIRNLVGNAIKFTQEGGMIRIAGSIHHNMVRLMIEDNGIGMTEEETGKLFHRDEYFTRPGTRQEKGTGIGLLICREMVVNNGGFIEVISSKEKGTTFTVTLPCEPQGCYG
jgi:signal transduction histidine kinase